MNTENQRKKELRTGVKAKYTAYLNDLYIRIKNDEVILMNDLTSSYKIGKQCSPILQSKKIIKKLSRNKFLWIGKKPTPEMADMLIEVARINSYNYQQKEVGQKEIDFKTPVTKPIEKPEVKVEKKSFAVSLLWGMFKYQKD